MVKDGGGAGRAACRYLAVVRRFCGMVAVWVTRECVRLRLFWGLRLEFS